VQPHHAPSAAELATILPPVLAARTRTDRAGSGEPAGVLIVLFDHAGQSHLLLTKRTEYPGHHSGEVSLPGGRHEASDVDLRATPGLAPPTPPYSFAITSASGAVLAEADVSPADLAAVRARWRASIRAAVVSVLALALLLLPVPDSHLLTSRYLCRKTLSGST
jgi:hypothetical protein